MGEYLFPSSSNNRWSFHFFVSDWFAGTDQNWQLQSPIRHRKIEEENSLDITVVWRSVLCVCVCVWNISTYIVTPARVLAFGWKAAADPILLGGVLLQHTPIWILFGADVYWLPIYPCRATLYRRRTETNTGLLPSIVVVGRDISHRQSLCKRRGRTIGIPNKLLENVILDVYAYRAEKRRMRYTAAWRREESDRVYIFVSLF